MCENATWDWRRKSNGVTRPRVSFFISPTESNHGSNEKIKMDLKIHSIVFQLEVFDGFERRCEWGAQTESDWLKMNRLSYQSTARNCEKTEKNLFRILDAFLFFPISFCSALSLRLRLTRSAHHQRWFIFFCCFAIFVTRDSFPFYDSTKYQDQHDPELVHENKRENRCIRAISIHRGFRLALFATTQIAGRKVITNFCFFFFNFPQFTSN